MLARRSFLILFVGLILCASTLLVSACKHRPQAEDAPPEPSAALLSAFKVNDPAAIAQMTHGFHALEQNAWRWTAGKFGVALAPPEGAAERGAHLELRFNLTEAVFKQTGPVTLSATVGGTAVSPQRFETAGEHVYSATVSGASLRGPVTVEFSTDKVLPPGNDSRELSLVALEVSLTANAPAASQ